MPPTPSVRVRAVVSIAAIGVLTVASVARDARACGGCFHEPQPPNQTGTVVTDHRMIFSVSSQQTTLYDQIKYSGAPSSFAWVLPIRGAVTVGLSSDTVFASLEQATQTDIVAPILPPCPSSSCFCGGGGGSSSGGSLSTGASAPPPVTVISQQTIGPYATVQLQSTDPTALDAWLTANGYVIPPDVQPIIAAYVQDGFDFLALKLAPGQGIQAMRPVRVTSPGAGVTLPLRMVAAGTGATVGITLWVVGQGRYEPKNFQFFTIAASDLSWDWSANISDYSAVRARKEGTLNNAAWQIESSLDISPYLVESAVLGANAMLGDYVPVPASDAGDGGGGKGANQLRLEDLAALFPEGGTSVRITRMRADLSRAALANDLVLQASTDQSKLSNIYDVTKSVNAPQCPPPVTCNCGGGSGTPAASSSGGVITSGGGAAIDDAGTATNGLSPGGGGCAAATTMPGDGAVGFIAAGFLGTALLRTRRKRS
jgi:hypothetical protein